MIAQKVSCLITCHNELEFIGDAIASVQAQSASSLIYEILIIDDGSTDGSAEFLDSLAQRDPRLKIHHVKNQGVSAARNFGLRQVRAPFVALLDGDDLWHPDKLARQESIIRASAPQAAIWYTDFTLFTKTPSDGVMAPARAFCETDMDVLERYFMYDAPILPSTVVARTQVLLSCGLFDDSIRLFEEMDFWLRIAARGHRFQHVPGGLTFKRNRSGSASSNADMWEDAFERISVRWSALEPRLKPLEGKRRSFRLAKTAQQYFQLGADSKGWSFLRRALISNPGNMRVFAYGALAVLPLDMRRRVTTALKNLR